MKHKNFLNISELPRPGCKAFVMQTIRFGIRVVVVVIGLSLATGCQFRQETVRENIRPAAIKNFQASASAHFKTSPPRRVLVLHSNRVHFSPELPQQFANALADECRSRGLYEVIVPHNLNCQTSIDEVFWGRFLETDIIRLAVQHNADAVLLFRINNYQFYQPMKASVTVALVDARQAVLSFAADGVWDLADQQTIDNYTVFVRDRSGVTGRSQTPIRLDSPDVFSDYIAWQITESMLRFR